MSNKQMRQKINNPMSSEVDSDLKVVQGMAEQVKDVNVAIPKPCPALCIDNLNV